MPETEKEYRALPSISQSALKVFMSSPEQYFHQFIQGGKPEAETSSMSLGTLLHTLILEPEAFDKRYQLYNEERRPSPAQNFSAKANKEWKATLEALAAVEGKQLVSAQQWTVAQDMLVQLTSHKLAEEFLFQTVTDGCAHNELSILWQDKTTGLELKSRIDRLLLDNVAETATIVDYKTTSCSNLWDFSWSVKKYGYDIQAAFYEDAVSWWLHRQGYKPFTVKTVFVPQATAFPYQVLGVVALGLKKIEEARLRYKNALLELKQCLDTGCWKKDTEVHTLFPDKPLEDLWEPL